MLPVDEAETEVRRLETLPQWPAIMHHWVQRNHALLVRFLIHNLCWNGWRFFERLEFFLCNPLERPSTMAGSPPWHVTFRSLPWETLASEAGKEQRHRLCGFVLGFSVFTRPNGTKGTNDHNEWFLCHVRLHEFIWLVLRGVPPVHFPWSESFAGYAIEKNGPLERELALRGLTIRETLLSKEGGDVWRTVFRDIHMFAARALTAAVHQPQRLAAKHAPQIVATHVARHIIPDVLQIVAEFTGVRTATRLGLLEEHSDRHKTSLRLEDALLEEHDQRQKVPFLERVRGKDTPYEVGITAIDTWADRHRRELLFLEVQGVDIRIFLDVAKKLLDPDSWARPSMAVLMEKVPWDDLVADPSLIAHLHELQREPSFPNAFRKIPLSEVMRIGIHRRWPQLLSPSGVPFWDSELLSDDIGSLGRALGSFSLGVADTLVSDAGWEVWRTIAARPAFFAAEAIADAVHASPYLRTDVASSHPASWVPSSSSSSLPPPSTPPRANRRPASSSLFVTSSPSDSSAARASKRSKANV